MMLAGSGSSIRFQSGINQIKPTEAALSRVVGFSDCRTSLLLKSSSFLSTRNYLRYTVGLYTFDVKCSQKLSRQTVPALKAVEKKIIKKVGRNEHHLWKKKDSAGSGQKALNLVRIVSGLPNERGAIFRALDKWTAFETEFPLIAAAKALIILRKRNQWMRVIQVAKWMLSKGQGATMATYDTLLLAFDMDHRLDEAESLWNMILHTHTRSISKRLFSRMISLYDHHEMKNKIIEVFADMEELSVRPDDDTVKRVARAFQVLGQEDKSKLVLRRYGCKWKYIHFKGERVKVRTNAWDEDDIVTNEMITLFNIPYGYKDMYRVQTLDKIQCLRTSNSATDESDLKEEQPSRQRLLVVANRLPVSALRNGEGSWQLELNVGGLVSALLGVKEFDVRLFGWAGVNVPDTVGQNALTEALAEKRCIPVFLAEETVNKYNSSCNNILWPLFHHLGLPQDHLATTQSFQSQFDDYKKANQIFADVINKHYEDGDIVWCHSYHLMFLPKCLKEHNSKMRVGWTLHSPFPKSEIHWTLPYGSQLLRAVLAADLVGFHTYDCVRHFVWACTHALGLKGTPKGVENQGILTRVFAFPIGIDSDQFIRALEDPHVQQYMSKLKERFAGRKVMLGVDCLDMIKGICQKMLAFEKFLEKNPDQCDKVVLLQIAVPTGTDVPEYEKLISQVHEIVGCINGRFGTLTAVPIHHLDQSLDFHALCALYAVTDVALFTSLRDGVNLASYEFIACQASKKGVLILSEFAAAAQPFDAEAMLVNPWDITEFAASLGNALNLPADEREKRHHCNIMHVTTHKYQEWAATFVSELNNTIAEAQARATQVPPLLTTKGLDGDLLKSSADVVTPLKELDEGGKHANPEPSNSEGGKQAIPEPSTSEGGALSQDSED